MNSSLDHQPNPDIYDSFIDFDMFSRLQPKTRIHRDHTHHFKPIAGKYSNLPFVQDSEALLKGLNPEGFLEDFQKFADKITNAVKIAYEEGHNTNDAKLKKERFHELQLTRAAFEHALRGEEEKGGIGGLPKTYPSIKKQLKETIKSIETTIHEAAEKSQEWTNPDCPLIRKYDDTVCLPYCPEESFSDTEWQLLMKTSHNYKAESPGILKYYGKYRAALDINQIMVTAKRWNHWSTIFQHKNGAKLILGGLPVHIEDRDDAAELKKLGIGAVLSAVEVFENHSNGPIINPVTPEEWEALKILELQLPTPDFETILLDHIQRGVEYINWNLENGRTTYVHCKAGKGRSALIVMCYLIKYHNFTAKEAFDLVKEKRPQAGFPENNVKMKTLLDFEKRVLATRKAQDEQNTVLKI